MHWGEDLRFFVLSMLGKSCKETGLKVHRLGWNLPVVEATVTAIVMQEPVVGLLVDLLKLNTFYETKEWNMNVSVGDASSHVIGPLLSSTSNPSHQRINLMVSESPRPPVASLIAGLETHR